MNQDTNSIIRAFLVDQTVLTAVVATRIHCPNLPQDETLPALGFLTVTGLSNPYIPGIVNPTVQFDCWGESPIAAREVYRAVYDVLQGIQNQTVTVDGTDYSIMSAIEELQGQDLQDVDIPNYYRVLTTFYFMIRAEEV